MTNKGVDIPSLALVLGWSAADLRLLGDLRDVSRPIEDEIERRGMPVEYMRALLQECPVMGYADIDNPEDANAWTLLRATPEQRARAFLAALGAHQ